MNNGNMFMFNSKRNQHLPRKYTIQKVNREISQDMITSQMMNRFSVMEWKCKAPTCNNGYIFVEIHSNFKSYK